MALLFAAVSILLVQCDEQTGDSLSSEETCVGWFRQIDRCEDFDLTGLDDEEILDEIGLARDCVDVVDCLKERWPHRCISAMNAYHECYYDLDCEEIDFGNIIFADGAEQEKGDPCYNELKTYEDCFDTPEELENIGSCVLIAMGRGSNNSTYDVSPI